MSEEKVNKVSAGGTVYNIEDAQVDKKIHNAVAEESNRAQEMESAILDELGTVAQQYFNADKVIKASAVDVNTLYTNATAEKVAIKYNSVDKLKEGGVDIPSATTESAGVMTAEDKSNLNNCIIGEFEREFLGDGIGFNFDRVYGGGSIEIPNASGRLNGLMSASDKVALDNSKVIQVSWSPSSNLNNIVSAGIYSITGERTMSNDNLPIGNVGGGHTFHARLTVLDSSIPDTTNNDDKCITQILTISNRVGGDGDIYVRTGRGRDYNVITWETWAKQQTNIEVGSVESLDTFVDNGIYSGVWIKGSYGSYPLTFVCVVINDYFIKTSPRRVAQFIYGLSKFDGTVVYKTRVGSGDTVVNWGDWRDINEGKINATVSSAVNAEKKRATAAEESISSNAMQYNAMQVVEGVESVTLQTSSLSGKSSTALFPVATPERAGVMAARDKATLDELKSIVEQRVENPLRPLYIAAGATYNAVTGFYELNGVNDLTENDMRIIYNYKDALYHLNIPRVLQGVKIRTMIPFSGHQNASDFFLVVPVNGYCTFTSTSLEILRLSTAKNYNINIVDHFLMPLTKSTQWNAAMYQCSNLKEIYPIDVRTVTSYTSNVFSGCTSLIELRLFGVAGSITISDSANISKESILYIVNNSTATSAITITLHPDAYARLADDADIVAALESKPLITLVSA